MKFEIDRENVELTRKYGTDKEKRLLDALNVKLYSVETVEYPTGSKSIKHHYEIEINSLEQLVEVYKTLKCGHCLILSENAAWGNEERGDKVDLTAPLHKFEICMFDGWLEG